MRAQWSYGRGREEDLLTTRNPAVAPRAASVGQIHRPVQAEFSMGFWEITSDLSTTGLILYPHSHPRPRNATPLSRGQKIASIDQRKSILSRQGECRHKRARSSAVHPCRSCISYVMIFLCDKCICISRAGKGHVDQKPPRLCHKFAIFWAFCTART